MNDFDWLLGSWTRVDVRDGEVSTEVWGRETDELWRGTGTTAINGDTVFVEQLSLAATGSQIDYIAKTPGNPAPVAFRMIESGPQRFQVANPDHDFPKALVYELADDTLRVVISGNGRSGEFVFVRSDD